MPRVAAKLLRDRGNSMGEFAEQELATYFRLISIANRERDAFCYYHIKNIADRECATQRIRTEYYRWLKRNANAQTVNPQRLAEHLQKSKAQ
jgi:uncharacterized protein YcaQ